MDVPSLKGTGSGENQGANPGRGVKEVEGRGWQIRGRILGSNSSGEMRWGEEKMVVCGWVEMDVSKGKSEKDPGVRGGLCKRIKGWI